MRGRSSAVPTVAIGQATVSPIAGGNGELDKAVVRRYVKRNIQKIQYCYEKELLAKPTLEGAVTTTFTITDAGTVGKTSATGVDVTVAACVGNVIQGIEFPRPKGTGGVAVSYLFTFERASSSP